MEQISEEDRKRIRHDATSYFEETFGGNRAEGYVAGASKELLSAQSRESILKEEVERLKKENEDLKQTNQMNGDGFFEARKKIQELEQKNKEMRQGLRTSLSWLQSSQQELHERGAESSELDKDIAHLKKLLKQ